MAVNPLVFDWIAFVIFCVLAVGYHVLYATFLRHRVEWSVKARMHEHRRNWVDAVLKRGERIMAVQALRNLIMTNTFLASTMILLVAFIANFVIVSPFAALDLPASSLFGAVRVRSKGVVLLMLYGFAFVMFLSSLRTLNHLSILVGVEPEQMRATEQREPSQFLAAKLNEVESMSTYGRRAVFFSLPVFGWFFSPWLFMILTVSIWFYFVLTLDFVLPIWRARRAAQAPPAPTPAAPTSK